MKAFIHKQTCKLVAMMVFIMQFTTFISSKAQTYSGTGPVSLNVPATATSVVWYKDGAVIAGQTATSYAASVAGRYYATYTEGTTSCTTDRSINFILANSGTNVTLNGTSNNGTGSNYQWYNGATAIGSATSANHTTSTGGKYHLAYNNGSCEITTPNYYLFMLNVVTYNYTNVCPATTVDLMTHAPLSPPAGTTVTFHSGTPATLANKINNATTAAAGDYYMAFEDAANDCYSPATLVTVSITACATCVAGSTAPAITQTTATNTCPATTANLATMTNTGTKPAGTTLIWSSHKLPTASSDTLSNLNVSTAGKYYALYYDKLSNCYSPADSVTLSITPCITANPNMATTTPATLVNIAVLGNDTNGGMAASTTNSTISITTPTAAQGTATVKADGTIDFTPAAGFVGTATFIYTLCDKIITTACDTATVSITVGCTAITAPVPTAASNSNICPSTSVDLTAMQPAAVAGQTYEWHTASSNPVAGTMVGTPATASAGIYYLYAKNTASACYSPASTGVTVNISSCGGACLAGNMAPVLIKN